jgi:hypothetical protein
MWLEPIHWPNTRRWEEEIAEVIAWFKAAKKISPQSSVKLLL